MKINIIVAVTKNMVIGKGNDMPWHLPTDLKNFKRMTDGAWVIMGRKCWESIPEKFRPLPNRLNFVLTKDPNFNQLGATKIGDFDKFMIAVEKAQEKPSNDAFIIGGGQIYKEAFKYADRIFLTHIDAEIEGDVYLEGFNRDEWDLFAATDYIEENGLRFRFETYLKKQQE